MTMYNMATLALLFVLCFEVAIEAQSEVKVESQSEVSVSCNSNEVEEKLVRAPGSSENAGDIDPSLLRFVTYGIGSSGKEVQGASKYGIDKPDSGIQSCEQDLKDAEAFATKYNRWIGSISGKGAGTVAKDKAVAGIQKALNITRDWRASLVLYYTGHCEQGTGDWRFKDGGRLALTELAALVVEAEVRAFVVADCSHAGEWAAAARNLATQSLAVVSASGPGQPARHVRARRRRRRPDRPGPRPRLCRLAHPLLRRRLQFGLALYNRRIARHRACAERWRRLSLLRRNPDRQGP